MRGSFFKELLKIQRRLWRNAAGRRFCRQEGRRKILLEKQIIISYNANL